MAVRPFHFYSRMNEIFRGSLKVIYEGVAVSALSDLWKISEQYEKKIPFFLRGERKKGVFLKGGLCCYF